MFERKEKHNLKEIHELYSLHASASLSILEQIIQHSCLNLDLCLNGSDLGNNSVFQERSKLHCLEGRCCSKR